MQVTLGGDRLGSGKKEQIDINEYGRSTHNLSFLWRSTMSAGTLVPFACEVLLPGDQWDIDLDIEVLTHPTTGPVFGSMKVQADILTADARLYQGKLHNNLTGVGLDMQRIKLPQINLDSTVVDPAANNELLDYDNMGMNPSCILSYLGIRGAGVQVTTDTTPAVQTRNFNAIPWIMYWDIYKNYYANQQEEEGAVIHQAPESLSQTVDFIQVDGAAIQQFPTQTPKELTDVTRILVSFAVSTTPLNQIILNTSYGPIPFNELGAVIDSTALTVTIAYDFTRYGLRKALNWYYADVRSVPAGPVSITRFPLSDIDAMRENILAWAPNPAPFNVNNSAGAPGTALFPWNLILDYENGGRTTFKPKLSSQEGLGLKTYNSDLFNNWLNTEWLDGPGGINELTAISVAAPIQIDTINFAEKLYKVLNRVITAGNTYDDYMDVSYTARRWSRPETPVYHGGLIKELVFQEVVSNSESSATNQGAQPLGTLAGRGRLGSKHKGGSISFKANEIGYVMGIISITPRIDNSQGNRWDTHLETMSDFRVPGLDEIGFQELITEQMAWWNTHWDGMWIQKSAGKQPAWQNYRTNVNRVFGNFAIASNEMFMTLNRRYRAVIEEPEIAIDDLTTYIDPAKYNWIFAQTSLDSQNFWVQIAVNAKVRRIMSARVIPNL